MTTRCTGVGLRNPRAEQACNREGDKDISEKAEMNVGSSCRTGYDVGGNGFFKALMAELSGFSDVSLSSIEDLLPRLLKRLDMMSAYLLLMEKARELPAVRLLHCA